MTELTELETKVLNEITKQCEEEYSAAVNDIAMNLEMSKAQVKGVVSSLKKKDKIALGDLESRDGERFKDIWVCRESKDSVTGWEILSWGEWS